MKNRYEYWLHNQAKLFVEGYEKGEFSKNFAMDGKELSFKIHIGKSSENKKWCFVLKFVLTYCEKKIKMVENSQNFWDH